MPLELIKYLSEYFYTKDELITASKVTAGQLEKYQALGVMPAPSYKVNMNVSCDSFFGMHEDSQAIELYAKNYASWLGVLQTLFETSLEEKQFKEKAFGVFHKRYSAELARLNSFGYPVHELKCDEPMWNTGQDLEPKAYIKEAWDHFIQGTYGVCTQSGLPEDIAAKAVAIFEINRLTELDELSKAELNALENVVDLLDESSALFAPHERLRSSRHRLVNEIRRRFKLESKSDL